MRQQAVQRPCAVGRADAIGAALQEIQDALERARSERGQVAGLLRLNVPQLALPMAITPVVTELAWRHPQLVVEVIADTTLTDIVAAGFDAGVRLGEMIERDMIAVRLTPPFKAIMVAAPRYLAAKGEPKSIGDLARHNCIGFRLLASGGIYAWDLLDNGEDVSVRVTGTVLVNDPTYAKELALNGVGIAYIFEPLVRKEIRDRGLTRWEAAEEFYKLALDCGLYVDRAKGVRAAALRAR